MPHIVLHGGLDPASKLFGIAFITEQGHTLEPFRGPGSDYIWRGYDTLRSIGHEGKEGRSYRLDMLEEKLRCYLRTHIKDYYEISDRMRGGEPTTWEIASFGIEQPSDSYFRGGAGGG